MLSWIHTISNQFANPNLIPLRSSYSPLLGAVSDQVKVKKNAKSVPKVLVTELGIKYIELKKGSGAFPTPNDFVIINYR